MDIDKLRKIFPNENCCRYFFETIRWPDGRICPHCGHNVSYVIKGTENRPERYECKKCKRQFTVTTKTPLHSTKLPLWKWLQAMYLITSSSKGVSSVVLSRWLGVRQPTAWKIGHAIRLMMEKNQSEISLLSGVVEIDEKYLGGKPRSQEGVIHKRGKGTEKQ